MQRASELFGEEQRKQVEQAVVKAEAETSYDRACRGYRIWSVRSSGGRDTLKVVPDSETDLLLMEIMQRKMVTLAVGVVQADTAQSSAAFAPRPAALQCECSTKIDLFAQVAVGGDEWRAQHAGRAHRRIFGTELKRPSITNARRISVVRFSIDPKTIRKVDRMT